MTTLEIQRALSARGFDPGPIDGIDGPQTQNAIIEFKKSVGLRPRAFVGPLTEAALSAPFEAVEYDQAWMQEAAKHLGLQEIPGKDHNPKILHWIRSLGGWFTDDETSWCGTFVAHCIRTAGYDVPKHWYRAKAWSAFGQPCSLQTGAIAVFGRKGGGHVGFVVGQSEDGSSIYILGGNQRNEVNISPIATSRLVNGGVGAIRWPAGEALALAPLPVMTGGRRTTNEA